MVTTVLMTNARDMLGNAAKLACDRGELEDTLFADDTLLIAGDKESMEKLLHLVEDISGCFGLKLNKDKCVVLIIQGGDPPKFTDGTTVKQESGTEYLGSNINTKGDTDEEAIKRIRVARYIWNKLQTFWLHAPLPKKVILEVYNSLIRSKLLYSLESARMTNRIASRINAFHLQGLRRILKLQTTFVNRNNTNELVYAHANLVANISEEEKKIGPLSDYIEDRAIKLIADILKAPNSDPRRQVCFYPDSGLIVRTEKLRQYGPRVHWLNQTINRMWDKFEIWRNLDSDAYVKYNEQDLDQTDSILQAAKQGLFDGWTDLGNWEMRTAPNSITLRPHTHT